jgi:hypothetical protein
MLFIKMATEMFLFVFSLILIAIFLPFRQADLAASALLQGTRGERHSFAPCASHLQQPRLVNNTG